MASDLGSILAAALGTFFALFALVFLWAKLLGGVDSMDGGADAKRDASGLGIVTYAKKPSHSLAADILEFHMRQKSARSEGTRCTSEICSPQDYLKKYVHSRI